MEKLEPFYIVGSNAKWYIAIVENSLAILQNLNIDVWYDSAVPFPDIYPKELKADNQTNTCTWVYIVALFTTAKRWKQLKYPLIREWIKNLWYIYIMEYYLAIKSNEILITVIAQMDPQTMIWERNQIQKAHTFHG